MIEVGDFNMGFQVRAILRRLAFDQIIRRAAPPYWRRPDLAR